MYGPLQAYQSMLNIGQAGGYGNLSQMAPSPYGVPYPQMQQNPYGLQFPGLGERSTRGDVPGLMRPRAVQIPKPTRRMDFPWPAPRNHFPKSKPATDIAHLWGQSQTTPKRPSQSPYAYARR